VPVHDPSPACRLGARKKRLLLSQVIHRSVTVGKCIKVSLEASLAMDSSNDALVVQRKGRTPAWRRVLPALVTLIAIRDRKVEALTDHKGPFELFHDVVAINRCLQEETEAVALFMMLHRHDPGLARRCYPITEEYLVEQQEFEVCIAYLPDPIAKFEEILALRRIQLEISDENPAFATSEFRDYIEMRFADALRRLIVILVGVGQSQDAQRVRELALAVSTSAPVQEALDEAMDGP
jgi:hypothetical protein